MKTKSFKFPLGSKVSYKLKMGGEIITGIVIGHYRTIVTRKTFPKTIEDPVNILAIMIYMPVGSTTPEVFWKEESECFYAEGTNAA